jgi:aspartate-semialdehyde dehydrogenase
MTFSVLLVGATGFIGSKFAAELAAHKNQFKRVAFLAASTDNAEKEARYAKVPLERVKGGPESAASYKGFDIVLSAVGDDLCARQGVYFDAALEGGVKHFYPGECKCSL